MKILVLAATNCSSTGSTFAATPSVCAPQEKAQDASFCRKQRGEHLCMYSVLIGQYCIAVYANVKSMTEASIEQNCWVFNLAPMNFYGTFRIEADHSTCPVYPRRADTPAPQSLWPRHVLLAYLQKKGPNFPTLARKKRETYISSRSVIKFCRFILSRCVMYQQEREFRWDRTASRDFLRVFLYFLLQSHFPTSRRR